MVTYVLGNDRGDTIIFNNGMIIKIDYGLSFIEDSFGSEKRFDGDARRISLFDVNKKIITELIQKNPDEREVYQDFSQDPDSDWLDKPQKNDTNNKILRKIRKKI